MIHQKLWELG
uniref:Uncharacterized protein n=1 Tax=Lepeophtheirus salmonis TaxID=72036 RepID=A0A0K2UWZ4_LEPSM